jgi:hypothetical protein
MWGSSNHTKLHLDSRRRGAKVDYQRSRIEHPSLLRLKFTNDSEDKGGRDDADEIHVYSS